jgi:hypothetical protein
MRGSRFLAAAAFWTLVGCGGGPAADDPGSGADQADSQVRTFLNSPIPMTGLSFANGDASVHTSQIAHLLLLPAKAVVRMGTGAEYSGIYDINNQMIGSHGWFLDGNAATSTGQLVFHFTSPSTFDQTWSATAIVKDSDRAVVDLWLQYVGSNDALGGQFLMVPDR